MGQILSVVEVYPEFQIHLSSRNSYQKKIEEKAIFKEIMPNNVSRLRKKEKEKQKNMSSWVVRT